MIKLLIKLLISWVEIDLEIYLDDIFGPDFLANNNNNDNDDKKKEYDDTKEAIMYSILIFTVIILVFFYFGNGDGSDIPPILPEDLSSSSDTIEVELTNEQMQKIKSLITRMDNDANTLNANIVNENIVNNITIEGENVANEVMQDRLNSPWKISLLKEVMDDETREIIKKVIESSKK